jgi:hypothetical protein
MTVDVMGIKRVRLFLFIITQQKMTQYAHLDVRTAVRRQGVCARPYAVHILAYEGYARRHTYHIVKGAYGRAHTLVCARPCAVFVRYVRTVRMVVLTLQSTDHESIIYNHVPTTIHLRNAI